ncbi:hypothetical protein ACH40F_56850 [Streptomyces sp. NPDC020794]|uniref:hypothetical protein n=1 Tax=unclassified Streptomyces TaxID=2593676 RepID=UPI0036E577E8
MAQLTIRDLYDLLSRASRRRDLEQDGIRLVYDGTAIHLSTADQPDTVIATARTCGFVTGSWDVTAYQASVATVMAWMRMLDSEDLIDVSPFWASARPDRVHPCRRADRGVPGDRVSDGSSRPASAPQS